MEDPLVGNSMGSTYDYLLGGFDNLLAVACQLGKDTNRMGDNRFKSFFSR
jgi:hypothetical protein